MMWLASMVTTSLVALRWASLSPAKLLRVCQLGMAENLPQVTQVEEEQATVVANRITLEAPPTTLQMCSTVCMVVVVGLATSRVQVATSMVVAVPLTTPRGLVGIQATSMVELLITEATLQHLLDTQRQYKTIAQCVALVLVSVLGSCWFAAACSSR